MENLTSLIGKSNVTENYLISPKGLVVVLILIFIHFIVPISRIDIYNFDKLYRASHELSTNVNNLRVIIP